MAILQDTLEQTRDGFVRYFGTLPQALFFSPGRVNLIGEHTDYNGGHVFPCAISLGTYAAVCIRAETAGLPGLPQHAIRIASLNMPDDGIIVLEPNAMEQKPEYTWANYPLGVFRMIQDHTRKPLPEGLDILLYGTLPNGAGLSSSASVEMLAAVICNALFELEIDRIELARLCQKAENEFVGMRCGIMDQFSVGMGKKDCAILLDCDTLEYRYSRLNLDGYQIVISNTNKKHDLVSSKYNERRRQCEAALAELQECGEKYGVGQVNSLGSLTEDQFSRAEACIRDPVNRRRARHAVYENRRTLRAVEALERNDLCAFGLLMKDSHISLRDDYEVSCPELDILAELAWNQPGVIGSRMTGGGFGGCTVSIVEESALEDFMTQVGSVYTDQTGLHPDFYIARITDGTCQLEDVCLS